MENIDIAKAQELGIKLINSPEGNKDAVAEHVIGTLLVLMNRLFISSNEVNTFSDKSITFFEIPNSA